MPINPTITRMNIPAMENRSKHPIPRCKSNAPARGGAADDRGEAEYPVLD